MKILKLNTLLFYLFVCLFCITACTNGAPKKVKAIVISEKNSQDFEQGYIEPKQEDTLTLKN